MKANKEKRETFKRLYSEGKTIKGTARELKVTAGTVRSWRNSYFPAPRSKFKLLRKKFKQLYICKNKDIVEIAKILGVTRQTVKKWATEYFPDMPNREGLFTKMIRKESLTVNELAFLLGMTRSSVLRLYKQTGSVPDELK